MFPLGTENMKRILFGYVCVQRHVFINFLWKYNIHKMQTFSQTDHTYVNSPIKIQVLSDTPGISFAPFQELPNHRRSHYPDFNTTN